MGELRVDGAASGDYDEDDLLDLMDSANWFTHNSTTVENYKQSIGLKK